ncbi:unnamed protein product [Calypogeia fissa]
MDPAIWEYAKCFRKEWDAILDVQDRLRDNIQDNPRLLNGFLDDVVRQHIWPKVFSHLGALDPNHDVSKDRVREILSLRTLNKKWRQQVNNTGIFGIFRMVVDEYNSELTAKAIAYLHEDLFVLPHLIGAPLGFMSHEGVDMFRIRWNSWDVECRGKFMIYLYDMTSEDDEFKRRLGRNSYSL